MTARYPELQGLQEAVSIEVLLDGEIVALDAHSKPDFAALWFHSRGSADPGGRLCFMAFDVLRVGDEELIDRPYRERRRILEDLSLSGPSWWVPEIHIGEGKRSSPRPKPWAWRASSLSASTPATNRGFARGRGPRPSTFRSGHSRCSAGFRLGSGVGIADVSCSAFVPRRESPYPASWNRAMTATLSNNCHI